MEKIDILYFKKLGAYSLILGGICAILSLIPAFMPPLALFFMPFLGTIAPLLFLLKEGLKPREVKTYAILGGISGSLICTGFLVLFTPLIAIIHLINKSYYDYGISNLNLFLCCLFFVMIAGLYVITNCVTGLITGVIYNYFKGEDNG